MFIPYLTFLHLLLRGLFVDIYFTASVRTKAPSLYESPGCVPCTGDGSWQWTNQTKSPRPLGTRVPPREE